MRREYTGVRSRQLSRAAPATPMTACRKNQRDHQRLVPRRRVIDNRPDLVVRRDIDAVAELPLSTLLNLLFLRADPTVHFVDDIARHSPAVLRDGEELRQDRRSPADQVCGPALIVQPLLPVPDRRNVHFRQQQLADVGCDMQIEVRSIVIPGRSLEAALLAIRQPSVSICRMRLRVKGA